MLLLRPLARLRMPDLSPLREEAGVSHEHIPPGWELRTAYADGSEMWKSKTGQVWGPRQSGEWDWSTPEASGTENTRQAAMEACDRSLMGS